MDTNEKQITSPIKAIRAKCIDCCCNQYTQVEACNSISCPLHPFRLGKNPYSKRKTEDTF